MFGKNEITSPFRNEETLLVNEVFPTIQGEGPDAGRVAVFVRLAKCNLRCYFCDTEFETGEMYHQFDLAVRVLEVAALCKARLVVVTGGEPLLQNIAPFVRSCNDNNLAVSVETAGTLFYKELTHHFVGGSKRWRGNLIVCSPKTPRISEDLIPLIGAYKYIIKAGEHSEIDGLPMYSTQTPGQEKKLFRPPQGSCIYVQPCDENDHTRNQENLNAATTICLQHGYRLSVQVHKIAGLR